MKVETKLAENIDEIKTKLNSLNGMFDSLEIGDHNLKEIFSHRESIEVEEVIVQLLTEYKHELKLLQINRHN